MWLQEPQAAVILAEQGWDGGIRPGDSDYLFVVEANIGFNKVSTIAEKRVEYSVDLSNLSAPTASVTITSFNPAKGQLPCRQDPDYESGAYEDLVARCYYDYVRVFVPRGSQIIDSSLQEIPAEWLYSEKAEPGQLDTVDEGTTTSFGTLMVVPFQTEKVTYFNYTLPSTIVYNEGGVFSYGLKLQKQSGLKEMLTDIKVTLPPGATLTSTDSGGTFENGVWSYRILLIEDVELRLQFTANE
jgi:hypothetical protein